MRDGTMTIEREYAPWPTATSALRATGAAVFVRAGLSPCETTSPGGVAPLPLWWSQTMVMRSRDGAQSPPQGTTRRGMRCGRGPSANAAVRNVTATSIVGSGSRNLASSRLRESHDT